MKKILLLLASTLFAVPAVAQVGVSVSIGDPGFYGRIDIGNAPRPRILYRDAVVVERVRVVQQPVYMRVPPGHARNWKKHCREYNACGERVYFVHNDWYNDVYTPHYRQRHGHQDRDHDRGHDDHRRGDHDGDKHHGNNGHGKGHKGKGHGKGDKH